MVFVRTENSNTLLCFGLFAILFLTVCSAYTTKEVAIDLSKEFKTYTVEELKQFDGSLGDDKPLYMAVKGVVFDVSKGKDFYGKGSTYNALTGIDCSRAVAKMSLDPSDLNNDLTGLTDEQLKSLDDIFEGTYSAKYDIVGYMDYLVEEVRSRAKPQANDEL